MGSMTVSPEGLAKAYSFYGHPVQASNHHPTIGYDHDTRRATWNGAYIDRDMLPINITLSPNGTQSIEARFAGDDTGPYRVFALPTYTTINDRLEWLTNNPSVELRNATPNGAGSNLSGSWWSTVSFESTQGTALLKTRYVIEFKNRTGQSQRLTGTELLSLWDFLVVRHRSAPVTLNTTGATIATTVGPGPIHTQGHGIYIAGSAGEGLCNGITYASASPKQLYSIEPQTGETKLVQENDDLIRCHTENIATPTVLDFS